MKIVGGVLVAMADTAQAAVLARQPTVAPYNIWSVVSGKITSVERGVLP